MRLSGAVILLTVSLVLFCGSAQAQTGSAAQTLDNLRVELANLDDDAAQLKFRLEELNHDLDPNNLERYFAGAGSIHPEQLRENRRRQLQAEKDRVVARLDQLAQRRVGLEAAVADAQARAYHESAMGQAVRQSRRSPFLTGGRLLLATIVVFFVIGTLAFWVVRRRQRTNAG